MALKPPDTPGIALMRRLDPSRVPRLERFSLFPLGTDKAIIQEAINLLVKELVIIDEILQESLSIDSASSERMFEENDVVPNL